MKKRLLCWGVIFAPLLCVLLCSGAFLVRYQLRWRDAWEEIEAGGDYELTLKVGDQTRYYRLHVPPQYDPSNPMPVVITLHGGGGNAEMTVPLTGMSNKADEEGFIVAYPNGSGRLRDYLLTWNAGNCCGYALLNERDDVGFIRALIEEIQTHLVIDPQRIYVTGISNGGMMSFALACELADKLAAAAPVAGAFNYRPCEPSQPISIVMFNGKADQRVPYEGGPARGRIDTSVAEGVKFWVEHNACDPTPIRRAQADGKVLIEEYQNCAEGTSVMLYTVLNGGHTWYGGQTNRWVERLGILDEMNRDVSATDELWAFFATHPKSSPAP